MSLANMSIIEKDDLIKKMPKDALKRELREPSGNLPLFLIAARLKEVESMEQEAMANQFAQEAQGEEPTIAHRLAREIMPQAPLSGMAAMPSPQPRPDPQGQMAQALAGPRREMPTVYRSFGGLAALGGAANPATYEALMQNPEILGLGPFLASRFLGGDDDTPDPEPAPVPQETRVLPPTVQVQPSQVPGSNEPVQIAGGDTLPTVRAQSGLRGKYPGDAARVTAEMLAAAARRRKESGKPRLYNQGRQISFEKTLKEGASPAAQMAAMFGIPSAIARQEERVFGGMDTLPPYQPESNPMALRSKGFTSPTRTLAHRGADEGASGLDYLKMMKDIAGDSDDLPTVFAQDGFKRFPMKDGQTVSDLSPDQQLAFVRNTFRGIPEDDMDSLINASDMMSRMGLSAELIRRAGGLPSARSVPQTGGPVSLLDRVAGQQRMAEISASGLRPADMVPAPGAKDFTQNLPMPSNVPEGTLEAVNLPAPVISRGNPGPGIMAVQTEQLADLPRAPVPVPRGNTVPPIGAVTSQVLPPPVARSVAPPPLPPTQAPVPPKMAPRPRPRPYEAMSQEERMEVLDRRLAQAQAAQAAQAVTPPPPVTSAAPEDKIVGEPVPFQGAQNPRVSALAPVAASVKRAPAGPAPSSLTGLPPAISSLYEKALDKKQAPIPTLGEAFGSLKQYYPKGRLQGIVDQREDEVKKVEAQDPVPDGMRDIRAMMDKRLKALDDSGLPFMTAAAAAIKGNQPTLVALTNAMIGYTAGNEQLKKQGLSLMKDMVDIDANIATLEASQRKAEADARSNLIAAREAAIKGDQEQENKLLAAAQDEIKLVTETNDRLQRSPVAAANAITNYAGMTFKTKAEQERFNTLLKASKTQNPGLSEFQHLERVMKIVNPRSSNFSAARFDMALDAKKARIEKDISKFENDNMASWVAKYNAALTGRGNVDKRVQGGAKASGADREKVLNWAYENGLYDGLPTTEAKQSVAAKFNPQSAQGSSTKPVVTMPELAKQAKENQAKVNQ